MTPVPNPGVYLASNPHSTAHTHTMQPTYLDLCQATKSPDFHGDKLTKTEFFQAVDECVRALTVLDAVKKTLFYGREFPGHRFHISENCRSIASSWFTMTKFEDRTETQVFSEQRAIDVIHAILGMATEAGELLELLARTVMTKDFDPVNFGEEVFDSQWYEAIGCKAVGMTFEEGQATNIAKLKKRFGAKFDAWYANNRDLVAERVILETNAKGNVEHAYKEVSPGEALQGTGVNIPMITKRELEYAINALSYDAASNTPDFMMAQHIFDRIDKNRSADTL